MDSAPGPLLGHDVVIMQQVSTFLSDDFEIRDADDAVIGRLIGTDSAGARFLTGPRRFMLTDGDGSPLLRIHDVMDFGRDTFELASPDGVAMATVRERLAFMRTIVSVEPVDGDELRLVGNVWNYDYQVLHGQGVIGQVSRRWPGLAHGLLGHNRYAVSFAPGLPPSPRLLILGTVIALDLVRSKRQSTS